MTGDIFELSNIEILYSFKSLIYGKPINQKTRIKELERIYGSKVGRPKNSEKKSELSPQEKIAQRMDMDVRTLRNYKMLADMIPELDDLVTTGIVIKTTAITIMRNLSELRRKIKTE